MTLNNCRSSSCVRKLMTRSSRRREERIGSVVFFGLPIFNTIALMATILRLPYTTAIRPSLRGGSLYGLSYLCPVSACTLLPQCAESTTHPVFPCQTCSPSVCRHDAERRGHDPQRADPSSPWAPPSGANR